jgi:hypothetical protein
VKFVSLFEAQSYIVSSFRAAGQVAWFLDPWLWGAATLEQSMSTGLGSLMVIVTLRMKRVVLSFGIEVQVGWDSILLVVHQICS